MADSVSGLAYSFFGSCLILLIINFIPGLSLRSTEEDEIMGIDDAEIGEFAYDYVEITRDVIGATEGNSVPVSKVNSIDRAVEESKV